MIQPSSPEDTMHPVKFPLTPLEGGIPPSQKFRPQGNYIRVDYQRAEKAGNIILPGQAKPLDWAVVPVLEKGPKCEFVKEGDKVIVALKGIIGGQDGMVINGQRVWFTQENLVVSTIE